MNRKIDETKLTAFVLGELEPDEAAEIERLLEESEELQAEVEAIRETVGLLEEEFRGEPAPALRDDQRAGIIPVPKRQRRYPPTVYKIAAALVLAVAVGIVYHNIPAEEGNIDLRPAPTETVTGPAPAQATSAIEPAAKPTAGTTVQSEAEQPAPPVAPDQGEKAGESGENASRATRPADTVPLRVAAETPPPNASKEVPLPASAAADAAPPGDLQKASVSEEPSRSAGEIWGTLSDTRGHPVPDVDVALENLESATVKHTLSDASGRFEFNDVDAPGKYSLLAATPGFKSYRNPEIDLKKGESVDFHPVLQLGETTESVTVAAPPPSIMAETLPADAAAASKIGQFRAPMTAVNGRQQMSLSAAKSRAGSGSVSGTGVAVGSFMSTAMVDRPAEIYPPSEFNTEAYDRIDENEFIRVADRPLSTFSIDVDTASYSNVRRFLMQRQMPPKGAVRIEELVNYFHYDYAGPTDGRPFAAHMEAATAPWNPSHLLLRVGLKGREIDLSHRKPGNFVFLIDVSGSMMPPNKLPLLQRALRLMVEKLNEDDRIAMVVYAGASGLVLPSTPCSQKQKILDALDALQAGGSTNGGAGIELAYRTARQNLIPDGINRVILATDGDFNVGVTNQGDLTRIIETNAKSGVFLTVLGFGMGNYKDSTLEKLADRGDGNYAYIDTLQEARKVLVEQIGGTLVTIAKDVKIQVEFNPREIAAYRLIGYENRLLRDQDFNDDTKDAGEIGAGHTVTVLYELVPPGTEADLPPRVDPLKYQAQPRSAAGSANGELLTLKLRYKEPKEDTSQIMEIPLRKSTTDFERASKDFRFAAGVAGFGMLLRDSKFKGNLTWDDVLRIAQNSRGEDSQGYRGEFIDLVHRARAISELEKMEGQ
ncbi:MAG: von Willebrand factor type A domain-containing protein [Acidobacteriota bacterium]